METVVNLPQAANIATLVAGIVALSLALKSALGPTVMYVTEQLKAAYPIRDGAGGLVALTVSLVMSGLLAGLAGLLYATPRELPLYVALGVFVGFFVSAGATEAYKASALVNVDKAAAIAEVAKANAEEKALSNTPPLVFAPGTVVVPSPPLAADTRGMAKAKRPAEPEPPRLGKSFSEAA